MSTLGPDDKVALGGAAVPSIRTTISMTLRRRCPRCCPNRRPCRAAAASAGSRSRGACTGRARSVSVSGSSAWPRCSISTARIRSTWAALALNGFVWPHVARLLAVRSPDPYRCELRNLVADSGAGGVWIALMGFNLLPSALLVAMLSMDKISAGGARLFPARSRCRSRAARRRCSRSASTSVPTTTMLNVVASLPLLVAYPIAVGIATYPPVAPRCASRTACSRRSAAPTACRACSTGFPGSRSSTSRWRAAAAAAGRRRC